MVQTHSNHFKSTKRSFAVSFTAFFYIISICQSIYLHLFFYLSPYLSVYLYIYTYLSISIYLYLSIYPSQFIYLSIYTYLPISIYLYIYLNLSTPVSIYLSFFYLFPKEKGPADLFFFTYTRKKKKIWCPHIYNYKRKCPPMTLLHIRA